MEIIILQSKLKEGLETVARVAGKNISLPILANVLLRGEKNFLSLETTDLELGIKRWLLAKIEQSGSLAVPVDLLLNLLQFLPEKSIRLTTKDQLLSIETNSFKTQIKGSPGDDFPIIPQDQGAVSFKLPTENLCRALEQVTDIAVPSTARPEIAGIYFLFQKEKITLAATDSFRLGEKTLSLKKPLKIEDEYSFILPQKTAKEIVNIFGGRGQDRTSPDFGAEIEIFLGPNQVLIESVMPEISCPGIHLVSRLIEGEYPNYQEIIPKKSETQVVASRGELSKQVKLASLFSGKINEVKVKTDPKKGILEIFSQSPELGQHYSSLSARVQGKEKEVSFNHRFLLDGLLKIKSSEVMFELTERNGEIGPGILKPVGDQSYIYVLMPIQAS